MMVEDWMKLPTGAATGYTGREVGHPAVTEYTIANRLELYASGTNSVSGNWLIDVYNRGVELSGYDDKSEGVYEIAEDVIPIYNDEIWDVFAGLHAWDFQSDYLDDYPFDNTDSALDMTHMARTVLYDIATQVLYLYAKTNDIEV
jgi:hypothetical protein